MHLPSRAPCQRSCCSTPFNSNLVATARPLTPTPCKKPVVVEQNYLSLLTLNTPSMYSNSIQSPGPTNGEKREPTNLNPTTIAQAVDRSTDNGRTLVLSKLNLSDVSAEAAEELATVGRARPDDDCTIERFVVYVRFPAPYNPCPHRITLGNNRLTTLPTEFALLSRLRYLNLKHNNFSNFPDVVR